MKLVLEKLPWDSSFFNLQVGRIEVAHGTNVSASALQALVCDSHMDLIYVFLSDALPDAEKAEVRQALAELSGVSYDTRIVFRKLLGKSTKEMLANVSATTQFSEQLEALAYASGVYSRFALDPQLAPFFHPMYRLWLKKELSDGKVFVWPDENRPQGMATVSIKDGMGKIGLVAVSAESRGKGVASRLMAATDVWLRKQGVCKCEVATQGRNRAARALYEKTGFSYFKQQEIWHIWRSKQ